MAADPWPDHTTCLHCGEPITWDEVCYTHDSSGFADCHLLVVPGKGAGRASWVQGGKGEGNVVFNPDLVIDDSYPRTRAYPVLPS